MVRQKHINLLYQSQETKNQQKTPEDLHRETHHGEPTQTLQELAHSATQLRHKRTHAYFHSVKQTHSPGQHQETIQVYYHLS